MSRKRSSIIWTIEKERFQEIVNDSKTLRDILEYFKLMGSGATYKSLKKRLVDDKIEYSHIKLGLGHNKGKIFKKDSIPLEEIMIKNSTYNRGHLKKRLLRNGMIKNECCLCGQIGEWKGKKLIMILDHINGISNDNRIENLRMVCPNCNSQLDTTNGKNRRKIHNCKICGRPVKRTECFCKECRPIKYKINPEDRPSKKELEKLIIELPMTKVGEKYGVSDNAIRKWCKKYGLQIVSKPKYFCLICGSKLLDKRETGKCFKCYNFQHKKQIPSKDELLENLKEHSYIYLSKKYNVSQSLVRKWSRKYNLNRKEIRKLNK
jgi:transposase-like protein